MLTQGTNVAHIVLLLSMSLKLTDITQWNVGAVVLEQFLLLTKGTCQSIDLCKKNVWPRYVVKMRLRLNLKTACTTTMPP